MESRQASFVNKAGWMCPNGLENVQNEKVGSPLINREIVTHLITPQSLYSQIRAETDAVVFKPLLSLFEVSYPLNWEDDPA